LGANRFGRSPASTFQIEHPTISALHCEILLVAEGLIVRDCESTNGVFLDGEPVREATLAPGQTLRLGDVEFLVETTEVTVAIPQFDQPRPTPPAVVADGSMLCPRHPAVRATHQCTHCREVLCDACVHRLRRSGGRVLKLCPLCSHRAERIGGEAQKKRSFLGLLQKTIKIPFVRLPKKGPP